MAVVYAAGLAAVGCALPLGSLPQCLGTCPAAAAAAALCSTADQGQYYNRDFYYNTGLDISAPFLSQYTEKCNQSRGKPMKRVEHDTSQKDNDPDNDNEFNAALEFTTMIQVNMLSFNLLQKETPVSAQRAIISLADIITLQHIPTSTK